MKEDILNEELSINDIVMLEELESGKLAAMENNQNACHETFWIIWNMFKEHCANDDKEGILDDYRYMEFLLEAENNFTSEGLRHPFITLGKVDYNLLQNKDFIIELMKYCTKYSVSLLTMVTGKIDYSLKKDNEFMLKLINLNIFNYNFAANKSNTEIVDTVIAKLKEAIDNGVDRK